VEEEEEEEEEKEKEEEKEEDDEEDDDDDDEQGTKEGRWSTRGGEGVSTSHWPSQEPRWPSRPVPRHAQPAPAPEAVAHGVSVWAARLASGGDPTSATVQECQALLPVMVCWCTTGAASAPWW